MSPSCASSIARATAISIVLHTSASTFSCIAKAADSRPITYAELHEQVCKLANVLREHGNYSWLREKGSFVILNNGIEFAVTYLVMLLALLFTGGGRFVSADYYLSRIFPARA